MESRTIPLLAVLLLVDSLHFVFARLMAPYLPATVAGLYMLGVATVEVGLYLVARRRLQWRVFLRHIYFFLTIGFLVGSSTALTFTAVRYIDPGTASFLAQTSTLFALVLGVVWLRDRLSRLEAAGALVAVTGVFVIGFQPGDLLRWGALLVLVSTFFYALHAAVVKRYGNDIDFANFFLYRIGSTALFLFLFSVFAGNLQWPTAPAWGILLLAGTVDVVISRILYYVALRRLQISVHAVVLTLSPVVTSVWSLLLFGTWPTLTGFIGGAVVIAGVILVSRGRRRRLNRHGSAT
jgi:O-acetylserine/cysteine efflux transporter